MTGGSPKRMPLIPALASGVLLLGLAAAGLLLVRARPTARPQPTLVPEPSPAEAEQPVVAPIYEREPRPGETERRYTVQSGDLYDAQPGSVAPPPNPDEVLAHYYVGFDEDGFRRPILEADQYPIITLGDSMTEGVHAPAPWPDVLAAELGVAVRNLGVGSFNPPDYAQVMHLSGRDAPHDWVIVGFFEGDDLVKADDERPFTPPNQMRADSEAARAAGANAGDTPDYGDGPWKYPVEMTLAGQPRPLAVFEFYMYWLNGLPEDYRASGDLTALVGHLESIRADAGDACLLLVYIPEKSHVYLPFVADPAGQARLTESAWRVALDEQGKLGLEAVPETFEGLLSRLDSMSEVVGATAQEMGIPVVNLTGAFQEAAARGEETFYTYDTHLNQRGHDIIGETVADYIKRHPACGDE